MRNIEDLKEWVFIAKSDLDSASYLSHMKPFPTAIICYHSQQCVEKLLDIRYPYFEALTVQDGLMAIQHAQKVMRFYKETLNKLNINEIVID
ncbi:HEPN domain-containing protein [Bacillus cereus]|uniref:HEPN domain-containing protein n=1 Tax=Bacillus cereus TaxID=1396 RepID=UPI0018F50307|nr:HEPN domain-containing protein [Bacillus cereus]MBJ8154292.1 HEPN domain-containing protein [Bacillus cereus]